MIILVVGLIVFLGAHLVPGTHLRERIVARLGPQAYRGLFSVVAGVGLVLTCWGYGLARDAGPAMLYEPPRWLHHVTLALMLPAVILLVATYIPGRIRLAVRHPMITAVKIWALAHLLANGDTASVLLFGSFLAWGVVDRISLKRRETAGLITVTGGPLRNDIVAVVLGVLLYAAIVMRLHELLIGVPVA